jgi:Tol biopolymer transport system component
VSKRKRLLVLILAVLAGCGPEGYTRIDPGGEYVYANPAWSPDSQQIAYTRCAIYDKAKGRNPTSCELFSMIVATRETRQLTDNAVYDGQPGWSPDGTQIVYRREEAGGDSLRVIDVAGSRDAEILACPRLCQMPAWSPTNDVIAFQMITSPTVDAAGTAPSNLYLIQSDGGDLQQLTQGTQPVWRPRWSPDGKQIVFHRAADQPIRVIDVATQQETVYATKGIRGPDEPIFTPDGSGIVFSAYGTAQGLRLYRLDRADGSIGLLLNAAADYPPEMKEAACSPDGKQIVFSAFYEKLYLADVERTLVKRTLVK